MDEAEFKIGYYLGIARRRWLFLVLPFIAILSASVAVAVWLPPVYSSTGTVLIESQQIPDDLIRSTIRAYADERVQVIQQLVMTRSNLLQIIEKYDLLAEERDKLTVSEQVALMHQKIAVNRIVGDSFSSRSGAITAFTVTFEDKSPEMAYAVTNELVTLFLEENVRTRTARALETTAFFKGEAAKLKHRLEVIEERIANYKQENSQALPEHLDLHMNMLERTESSLEDVARDMRAAEDDYRFLEVELSAIQAGVANSNRQIDVSTPEQELLAAEAELAGLEASYSQLHPDVKRQKNRIAQLQKQVDMRKIGGQGSGTQSTATQGIDVARVKAGMVSMQKRIRSLESQYARLAQERSELEAVIIQTPQVQRALIALNRDYDNMLEKYNEMQSKEMQAKLTESLEEEKKAERFSLIDPPSLPDRPIRPNRKKVVAMGFILALLGSVGLVVLIEGIDNRLFEVESFEPLLDESPLAVIPYIITTEETERHRRYRRWAVSGGVAAGAVLLVGVHVFLMPLDMLAVKIMARLG